MRTPPLAIVAATVAICSGVTSSLSWPIAMRPTSISRRRRRQQLAAGSRSPRGEQLVGREVDRRLLVEAVAASCTRPSCSLPSFSPTSAHTVLTELVSASVRSMSPKSSPPKLFSGTPEIFLPFLPLTVESGLYLPGVDRRRGGDDLHRRAGRVARLRRAVDERRVLLVGGEALELVALVEAVGVVGGRRDHHEHLAAARARAPRPRPCGPSSPSIAACWAFEFERRADRVADAALAEQRVDRADQLGAAPGQRVVAELLEARAAELGERVADRVGEQLVGRVAARGSAPCRSARCARPPCRRRRGSCRA